MTMHDFKWLQIVKKQNAYSQTENTYLNANVCNMFQRVIHIYLEGNKANQPQEPVSLHLIFRYSSSGIDLEEKPILQHFQ
jgi:hypothetical protein